MTSFSSTISVISVISVIFFLSITQAYASPPKSYVALGDSWAAGLGYGRVLDEYCGRTSYSYAELFRRSHPMITEYANLACGRQGIDDIQNKQASKIRYDTQFVSITAGLWDLDIHNVIKHCDVGYDETLCELGIETAERLINFGGNFSPFVKMTSLVKYIQSRAKKAVIVLIGYPRFYSAPLEDCFTWDGMKKMSGDQKRRLNIVIRFLNTRYRQLADRTFRDSNPPVIFKDPGEKFRNHRMCDQDFWLKQYPRTVPNDFYENAWTKYGYYHPIQYGDIVYRNLLQEAMEDAGFRRRAT